MTYDRSCFESARRHRAHHAEPARPAQQLHDAMHAEVRDALAQVAADASARVLLLTGAGRGFCAGQDLSDRAVAPGRRAGRSRARRSSATTAAGARLAQPADAGRVRGQRRRGRRGRQHRARLRHRRSPRKSASFIQAFCKIGLDSGFRRHVLPAAPGRHARARWASRCWATSCPRSRRRQWGLIWKCVDDARARVRPSTRCSRNWRRRRRAASRRSSVRCTRRRQHARRAARPRARPAARARLQRTTIAKASPHSSRSARRASPAARARDGAPHCRATRRSPSSAPARWAPASRRSPRRPATRACSSTRAWARPTRRSDSIGETLRRAGGQGQARRARTRDAAAARIVPVHALGDCVSAKLVIEAIVEDLDASASCCASSRVVVAPDAILASNTSSLSITALAAGLKHPGRVVGMHFFNPAPLHAAGRGRAAASRPIAAVADTSYATAAAWGKMPVHATSTPGFIVNRCARPFYGEALRLLAERAADAATHRRGDARGAAASAWGRSS